MDKNTIWAIVLSTLVIIASYLILPKFFPGLAPMTRAQSLEAQNQTEAAEPKELDVSGITENSAFAEAEVSEDAEEEKEVLFS